MTYCPCTGHVVLNTAGMVSRVKFLSWKHNVQSDFLVVLDIYTEKPRNLGVKPLDESKKIDYEKNNIRSLNVSI